MSDEGVTQTPAVFSSKERAALVAKALSEAARRARFSTRRRGALVGGSFRAQRGARFFRLLKIATFVGIVVVPSLVASIYFEFIASDQYTAEARFTVRGGLPSGMDSLGALTGAPPVLIIQDTQIIMNYMQSRAIIEELEKSVGLPRMFQKPAIDYFSRLKTDQPIEKIVKYWNRHIELSVQMPAGIVVFIVKAFAPDDAVTIADAALSSSEQLVNRMNDQMRADTVDLAERERQRAQANLATARANLEKARNEEGMLSAKEQSSALTDLMTEVRGQIIKMQQDYDAQRRFVRADAPQERNLQTKIDAAKGELAKLQAQMTEAKPSGDGSKVLSGSMSRLDYATLNNQIAEKIYAGALTAFEHARVASEMKLMYINTFVRPVAAEQAKYPRRELDIALFVAASLAIWGSVVGLLILFRGSMA